MNCEQEQEGDHIDGHAGQGPALGAGAQGRVIQRRGQRGDQQRHQGHRDLKTAVIYPRISFERIAISKLKESFLAVKIYLQKRKHRPQLLGRQQ